MNRECYICHGMLREDDEIVAAMVTRYHEIPSQVLYAVENPSDCLGLVHRNCYGEEGHETTTED